MISRRVPLTLLALLNACLRRRAAVGHSVCETTAALIPTRATPATTLVRRRLPVMASARSAMRSINVGTLVGGGGGC